MIEGIRFKMFSILSQKSELLWIVIVGNVSLGEIEKNRFALTPKVFDFFSRTRWCYAGRRTEASPKGLPLRCLPSQRAV